MSGATSPHAGMTRRNFLKTAGVAAGALGLTGAASMTTTSNWLAPAEAHADGEERVAYVRHQFHCLGECCLKCTVRDGRLALIEPNDAVEEEDQRICLRGIAEVQHVYAADRLQVPLKRVGERGEGKFEQISWDEAIETIANAIKESQEKYGEDSFFFRKSTEASSAHGFQFIPQLLHADTGGNWGLDRGQANGWDPGMGSWTFLPSNTTAEWCDAATVILLGDNLLESGIIWSRALFDAKEAGTKIIAIDTRFSPTCSKAHEWICVKPATDLALILGMINIITENKWYDVEFMQKYTGFGFLIDRETGEIMGKTEDVTDELTGTTTQVKVPMIWDTVSDSAKYYNDEGVVPALEGEYEVEGKAAITSFSLMQEQFAEYTPEWASGVSGVPSDTIYNLADQYANAGPAFIAFGLGGPDKYCNADALGHALVLVTALTGNIGKVGCGTGWYGAGGACYAAESLQYWTLPEQFGYGGSGMAMYDMPYQENNIHCALTFGDAFTLESGSANNMIEWVKSLDFFAIVDLYHSSAVDYADIVLPACTKFECEEDIYNVRDGKGYLSLSQKVLDPLFECKTDLQIERLLAAQWGYEDYLPESYEELARFMLSNPTGNMEGFTVEALQNHQGVLRYLNSEEPPRASLTFPTPTGVIEPYYENMIEYGQAFPVYVTPNEAYEGSEQHSKYPLFFVQGKSRFRIHAYYSASEWFQEYFGPIVNMSPSDAEARGIETGDDVRVFNDRGEFVCRAFVNNSIAPGTLFMAETTYNHYYKEGFLQNVTNAHREERQYLQPFGPQIPFNDTLVEIQKA